MSGVVLADKEDEGKTSLAVRRDDTMNVTENSQ